MQHLGNAFIAIILSISFLFNANAETTPIDLTFIVAADMPNISDPTSGKYAELATLVREQRATNNNVIFIFGGDAIGPSALATFDRGSHIIDLLNSIEPTAMGITKREFSFFEDELSLRAQEAAFPLVTSNMIDTRTGQSIEGIANRVIVEQGDIKLGIISLMHEQVINEYLLKHAKVLEPFTTLNEQAKELKTKGVDVILLHYSYPFTFINTLLQQGVIDIAFLSNPHLGETYYEENDLHPSVLALKKPGNAVIGHFVFNGTLQKKSTTTVSLSEVPPSNDIESQVHAYQNRLDRLLDIQIGVWGEHVSTARRHVRSKENRFANFIVDAMLQYSKADIALINGGSIRGNTEYKIGEPITRRTILSELPFLSKLRVINITGEKLTAALENGLAQMEIYKGGFPHIAGLEVVINSNKPANMRVISVHHNNKPIEADRIYKLATTDFLANGGDGYSLIELLDNESSDTFTIAPLISELVTQAVIQTRTVKPDINDRIRNEASIAQ
jgi:2',3'-cyclic-nucleotide 2'-phosphodiesterase (5'-nucleotidase family)